MTSVRKARPTCPSRGQCENLTAVDHVNEPQTEAEVPATRIPLLALSGLDEEGFPCKRDA